MRLDDSLNDGAVLEELGKRLTQRRLALSWTQEDLASKAGIGKRTLERLEAGESVQLASLVKVLRHLGLLESLDAFLPEEGPRPMDLLKLGGKARQRASRAKGGKASSWSWGDET